MTIEQKIPQSVPVATGQVSNGITAINNRANRIESAAFGFVSKALTGTSGALTSAEFWEGSYFLLTGTPSGAFTLSVPAEERGPFTVFNDTGQPVTVQIAGQSVTAPIVAAGTTAHLVSDGVNVRAVSASGGGSGPQPFEMVIAVSDETSDLATGTAKVTFRMPDAVTLTEVRASLRTASSSGTITVDINEGGVSILSTPITIDANEKTSLTAAVAAVISDTSLADDAEITVDIDTAGTGAKGLKIALIGTRT